jgi:hypothetical protein
MRKTILGSALIALIAVLGGCGKADKKIETFEGTASVGGADAKITGCKARQFEGHAAVFFTLDTGHTVVAPAAGGILIGKGGEPAKVECASYSGGGRGGTAGGKVWRTGDLDVSCMHDSGEVRLKVEYDCGSKDRPSNLKSE